MTYPELDLAILKAITTNKKQALDFTNECSINVFSSELWNIANLIVGYIKTYKDIPTLQILQDKLSKTNPSFVESLNTAWKSIENTKIDDKEYVHNIEKLKERFANNEITKLKDKLTKLDGSPAKALDDVERTVRNIKSLTTTKTYERKTLKDSLDEFKEEINAKLLDPNFDSGLLTGYSFIDEATDGLRPAELLIVGGESGSGKSLLLMNMAIQMWLQGNTIEQTSNFTKGHNVLYFSLEMPFKACRNRMFSRLSGVPSKIMKRPLSRNGQVRLTSDHRNSLTKMAKFIKNYPYQFELIDLPRGATPEAIELMLEESIATYNPDIIAIDYLGLMELDSNDDDWLKLGKIAGMCHEMCRVHNIIGLTAVQLNRTKASSKDTEDKIGLHRVGRSALIMTHANVGIQIETRPNEKNFPNMNCHIIKNRDGENMVKGTLLKNLQCATLLDQPKTENELSEVEFVDVDDLSGNIELFDI